jgi:hypothetical protein
MKNMLLFFIGCFFMTPIFGQSQMKLSAIFAVTSTTNYEISNPNLGISIGHQHHLFNSSTLKVLMSEILEYKKAGFNYFDGGRGGGASTTGNIHFLNIKTDARARAGNTYFVDLGLYGSYALLNQISDGKTVSTQACILTGPPPGQYNCPAPKIIPAVNDFSNIDFGFLVGGGFKYKKIILSFDVQVGLMGIIEHYLDRSRTTLQQVNLSIAFPLSSKKKE